MAAGAFHKVSEDEWHYSAADVLCLPYREVTQSGVAQKGFMCELLIIATDVGEMKDVCRNGKNGILLEIGCVKNLVASIVNISSNNKYRINALRASKILVEEEFTLSKKAETVFGVYKNLMLT